MKKNLFLMSALCALTVFACGDKDKGKTEDPKQNTQSNNDKKTDTKTDDSNSDGSSDARTDDSNSDGSSDARTDDNTVKPGTECNTELDGLYLCQGREILMCEQEGNDLVGHWIVDETCESGEICIPVELGDVYVCRDACNPAIDNTSISCEFDTEHDFNQYVQEIKTCEPYNGSGYWKYDDKVCSSCGADNSCIISEADKGADLKIGDQCNYYLFSGRCENGNAINCVSNDDVGANGMVVMEPCNEQCTTLSDIDDHRIFTYCDSFCELDQAHLHYFSNDNTNCYDISKQFYCENQKVVGMDMYVNQQDLLDSEGCNELQQQCTEEQKNAEEILAEYQQKMATECNETSPSYNKEECDDYEFFTKLDLVGTCIDETVSGSLVMVSE